MRRAVDPSRPSRATTSRGRAIRLGFLLVATLALVGSLATRDQSEAAANADEEAGFVVALNEVRAEAGLPPFIVNAELTDLARGHAQLMADAGEIFHADPISAGYGGPWAKIGENVGVGAGVSVLVDAFVASPGHYANIVDPSFTEIGVGVVWRDNALYTTHRFLQVTPQAPATTAPPTTAPTSPTIPPPPTTTVPIDDPAEVEVEVLPPPSISAERVVALLDLLEQVGS